MHILDWKRWSMTFALAAMMTTTACDSEPELPPEDQANLCADTEACASCNSADCQESVDIACEEAERVPAQSFCASCHSESE